MHRRKHSNEPDASPSSQQHATKDDASNPSTMQRQAAAPNAAICSAAVLLAVVGAVLILLLHQPEPDQTSQTISTFEPAGIERFATGLQPPYYSVIFTSQRTTGAGDGTYAATAALMAQLASDQPGYLGAESTRGPDGLGITVSYWRDAVDIANWRRQVEHTQARDGGRACWYTHYELRVAKVERAYAWDASEGPAAPVEAHEMWLQQDS